MALLVSMLPVVSTWKCLRSKKNKKSHFLLQELAPRMGRYIEGSVTPVYSGVTLVRSLKLSFICKVMIAILSSCFIQLWDSNRDTSKTVRVMQFQGSVISLFRMQGVQLSLSLQGTGSRALRLESVDVPVSYINGLRDFLVVQRLRLRAPNVEGPGLIPGLSCSWGTWELVPGNFRHFPGSPVVKTLSSQCSEPGFSLWSGD